MAQPPTIAGRASPLSSPATASSTPNGAASAPTVVKATVSGQVAPASSRLAQVAAANQKAPGSTITTPSGGGGAKPGVAATVAPPFIITESGATEEYVKLLVYADFGVGKTFLTGTAAAVPQMQDVFLLNAESGDLTLKSADPIAKKFGFDSIDAAKVTTFKQVARVYEFLRLHCQYRDADDFVALAKLESQMKGFTVEPSNARQYYTVIIDSLTEVEAICMYQLLGVRETISLDTEMAGAEWAEYKKQTMMIQRMIRAFRNLPMNVLMTCSRGYVQDEAKRFNFSPMMTGKLSSTIQGFMDMVGYLTLREVGEDGSVKRRLWVQPAGKFAAKNRFTTFKGSYIDDPTMGRILQLVGLLKKDGGVTSEKEKEKAPPAKLTKEELEEVNGALDDPTSLIEGDGTPSDEELAAIEAAQTAA